MRTTLAIDGMFCGGCAASVERVLARLPGVHSAAVSFVSDAAVVEHDPRQAPVERLVQAVVGLGYAARAFGESEVVPAAARRDAFHRRLLIRLAVAVAFGMWTMLAALVGYMGQLQQPQALWWQGLVCLLLALPVLVYSGAEFYRMAWRSLKAGAPAMEALISLAVLAAVAVSVANLASGRPVVYADAAVMLITFQLIARLTDYHVRRDARDSLRALLALAPERARRLSADGSESWQPVRELAAGDQVRVLAGERMPVDGTLIGGEALVDEALLTGESAPRPVHPGDGVRAGTVLLDGALTVRVDGDPRRRMVDRLATEVRRVLIGKSALARLVDRVARWLLPALLAAAAVAAVVALMQGQGWPEALRRALAVLIVTCPCALSLAVPLAVARAAASGRRLGALLRDPAALELAASVDTVLLDKTGTLTAGSPVITRLLPAPGVEPQALLAEAARLARASRHPLSVAIAGAAKGKPVVPAPAVVREIAGRGILAEDADGRRALLGSAELLRTHGVRVPELAADEGWSLVYVARDGRALGAIALGDALRPEAPAAVAALQRDGLRVLIASGDRPSAVESLCRTLAIEGRGGLSPDDKAAWVAELRAAGHRVAFVGDGLNDAPALAAADVGIAVDSASELARSASAVTLLDGGIGRVRDLLRLLRSAGRVMRQNLVWAAAYNTLLIPAAASGHVAPLYAALAMAASSISVLLNSLRIRLPGGARRAGTWRRQEEVVA